MTLINTHCNGESVFLQGRLGLVAAKLANGAAVIGEDHGKARGRAVVGDLIDAGHVGELYLELPDEVTVAEVIDATPDAPPAPMRRNSPLAKRAHGTQTIGEYLRHVVNEHELTDTLTYYYVFIDHLSAYIGKVERLFGTGGGGISLATLMDLAVTKGALVYLFDDLNGDPSLKKRNQAMAPHVNVGAKALLLNGIAHLTAADCSGAAYTVQYLCGIAADRVFDIS